MTHTCVHDDVIKWKQLPRHWPFVGGIHRSQVNSSHKGQWRGALMFSLLCARTNGWANHRDAGDLRRHRVHFGVTEMSVNYVIIGFDDRCHLFGAKPLFGQIRTLLSIWAKGTSFSEKCKNKNKANLRDLIDATGMVILLEIELKSSIFCPCNLEIW